MCGHFFKQFRIEGCWRFFIGQRGWKLYSIAQKDWEIFIYSKVVIRRHNYEYDVPLVFCILTSRWVSTICWSGVWCLAKGLSLFQISSDVTIQENLLFQNFIVTFLNKINSPILFNVSLKLWTVVLIHTLTTATDSYESNKYWNLI